MHLLIFAVCVSFNSADSAVAYFYFVDFLYLGVFIIPAACIGLCRNRRYLIQKYSVGQHLYAVIYLLVLSIPVLIAYFSIVPLEARFARLPFSPGGVLLLKAALLAFIFSVIAGLFVTFLSIPFLIVQYLTRGATQ